MLPTGTQLGHYRIVGLIKRGGMGEIYQAQDMNLPRQVAIKVILGEQQLYPDPVARAKVEQLFRHEMEAVAQLDHPHILQLWDFGKERVAGSEITYMVMPLRMEGSLVDWVQRRGHTGPLPATDVAYLVAQAADALQYAHNKGIIHRDVKPSNFLIREWPDRPNRPDMFLADFGIAKISEASKSSTSARGTMEYMSPEQIRGNAVPASDQYSLAIMAYELLTGSTPFAGAPPEVVLFKHFQEQPQAPSAVNPSIPRAVDPVILRALAKNPADRYPTIQEFAKALQAAASGQGQGSHNSQDAFAEHRVPPPPPFTVPPLPPQPRPSTPAGRQVSTGVIVAVALIVILVIGSAVGIAYGFGRNNNNTSPSATANAVNSTNTAQVQQHQNDVNATATALANANATATALASPQLVLNDSLSSNSNSGWDETTTCYFNNGFYNASQTTLGYLTACFATNTSFSNFYYEVRIGIAGDTGGIIFRASSRTSYYCYEIDHKGNYDLFAENNGHYTILARGFSAALNQGNQGNNLEVRAYGNTITIYANRQTIKEVTDSIYNQGMIGVAVGTVNTASVAAFSNARVWVFQQ